MPDLSHERQRLYALVDKWIDQQAAIDEEHDEEHRDCGCKRPTNVRVISAAMALGVNYEMEDGDGVEHLCEGVFSVGESKDSWSVAGLLQAGADDAKRHVY